MRTLVAVNSNSNTSKKVEVRNRSIENRNKWTF